MPQPTSRLSGRLLTAFLLTCAIWGSTWMAIRVVVVDVPPLWAAAVRFIISALLLALIAAVARKPLPRSAATWRALVILGITMIALPYGLLFWAERRITSGMAAV